MIALSTCNRDVHGRLATKCLKIAGYDDQILLMSSVFAIIRFLRSTLAVHLRGSRAERLPLLLLPALGHEELALKDSSPRPARILKIFAKKKNFFVKKDEKKILQIFSLARSQVQTRKRKDTLDVTECGD